MFVKVAQAGLLAGLVLVGFANPAEAFGRRQATTCYTPYCYPCYPCEPCHHGPCLIYHVSHPHELLRGPYTNHLRVVHFGYGVIVEIEDPTGLANHPTGQIQVIQSGPGEVRFEGYNKRFVHPGVPGAPVIWSVFLCPTKIGKTDVKVGFMMSDNTVVNVALKFDITPQPVSR